jgi:rhodanese-related sulfurtransferase
MLRAQGFPFTVALAAALFASSSDVAAQEVGITETLPEMRLTLQGREHVIQRNQDQTAMISGEFAKTSRACPPFCIHPMKAAPGVQTVGELEVMDFLKDKVATGSGVLMDSRLPEWAAKGTIPGAVNVPFTILDAANPYRDQIIEALGAKRLPGGGFDFSSAMELTVFCNGAWSDQAARQIAHLIAVGYPADKISYYRGGMQGWLTLGLTVQDADNQG